MSGDPHLQIPDKILGWKPVAFLIRLSKKVVLPGFDGIPLYDVAVFFINGLTKGYITSRASAISFNFFLAIFPTLIFFFTIIPFIPITNFQGSLLTIIRDFLPDTAYATVQATLEDIITRPRGGLLSIGFLLSVYFSTNGINSLMEAFDNTYHSIETRTAIKQRLISIFLVVIITILLILSIGLITFGTWFFSVLLPAHILNSNFYFILLVASKWLMSIAMLFFAISFIYYFAPAKKRHFRFISAGSSLATLLIIITALGFNYYVDNFSKYNVLYGSIGTLLVILLWIYFISFSLLIGFELNASILHVKRGRAGK
ncbi:MAG: YihY/virulence factor BrkB family protein [Bacteroidetes bacterium]|nr:YihY/virulence factor BrkB family protein [Bacteroidota bacterium]